MSMICDRCLWCGGPKSGNQILCGAFWCENIDPKRLEKLKIDSEKYFNFGWDHSGKPILSGYEVISLENDPSIEEIGCKLAWLCGYRNG